MTMSQKRKRAKNNFPFPLTSFSFQKIIHFSFSLMSALVGLSEFLPKTYHCRCPCYEMESNVMFLAMEELPSLAHQHDKSHSLLISPFSSLEVDEPLVWHEAHLLFTVFILLRLELLRYGSYFKL